MTSIFKGNDIGPNNSKNNARKNNTDLKFSIDDKKDNPNLLVSDSNNDYDVLQEEGGSDDFVHVLDYNDIIKTIPCGYVKTEIINNNDASEWRWRFFDFNGRKLVEISKKEPNKARLYIDNKQNWVISYVDEYWDKFVVETYYYYIK